MSLAMELNGDVLKELLPNALIYRGEAEDLDSLTQCGIYNTVARTTCANPPVTMKQWRYAVAEVLNRGSMTYQRLTRENQNAQRYFDNDAWSAWKEW